VADGSIERHWGVFTAYVLYKSTKSNMQNIFTLAALVLPKDKGFKNQKSALYIHNHYLTDNISDHVLL